MSEQDICFDSKDLIDSERNAVDLNNQRDSKGQMSFTSFKIWNMLQDLEYIGPKNCANTCAIAHTMVIQQIQLYSIVFRNVLASNQISALKEATYNPLICYEKFLWTKKQQAIFGCMVGKLFRQPYAQQGF